MDKIIRKVGEFINSYSGFGPMDILYDFLCVIHYSNKN